MKSEEMGESDLLAKGEERRGGGRGDGRGSFKKKKSRKESRNESAVAKRQ